jgi:hypothetical protein
MAEKKLSAAEATRRQELTSAWIFRRALKDNKKYNTSGDIIKDPKFKSEVIGTSSRKGIYPEIDSEWLNVFFLQQKKFLDEFSNTKFTEFTREYGFMKYISDLVKKKYGIGKKDTWDPADIWCVQNESKVIADIEKVVKNGGLGEVEELNALLRTLFKKRIVVGISLKKTSKGEAHYKEFNVDEGLEFLKADDPQFDVYMAKIDFLWDNNKKDFKSNSSVLKFYVQENNTKESYILNIKSNSLSHFKNLAMTPKSELRSAAQEGSASIAEIIKTLDKFKIGGFNNDWNEYPTSLVEFNDDVKKYTDMMDTILKNRLFETKITNCQQFVDNMEKLYLSKIENYDHIANSKLMQLHFMSSISKLSKTKLDQFVTELFFLGQKKGKGFGPFGKIY